MGTERRRYFMNLNLNGRRFRSVVIDPHYEEKHRESIDDVLILRLVRDLEHQVAPIEEVQSSSGVYFVRDWLWFEGKPYKLICFVPDEEDFLGVINCYRRPRGEEN